MTRWLLFVFGTGCAYTAPDVARTAPEWTTPGITNATVDCITADAVWTFTAATDAWSGNGQVVLSTEGDYIERHPLYSNGAAADGTTDNLKLTLDVVAGWRDVVLGDTTAFNCDTAGLTGVIRVYTRDGDDVADCRAFGEDPARWDTWDPAVSCPTVITLNTTEG